MVGRFGKRFYRFVTLRHPIYRLLSVALLTLVVVTTPVMASFHLTMVTAEMDGCMTHTEHAESAQATTPFHCEHDDSCGTHGCSACGAVQFTRMVAERDNVSPGLYYLHSHIDYPSSPPERPPRA